MPSQTREEDSRHERDDDDRERGLWRWWNGQRLDEWMAQRKCQDCRFWAYSERSEAVRIDIGECRRNPPLPIGTQLLAEQLWAYTRFDNWCGEFRRKP